MLDSNDDVHASLRNLFGLSSEAGAVSEEHPSPYIYMCVFVCMYIYTERVIERECEREGVACMESRSCYVGNAPPF